MAKNSPLLPVGLVALPAAAIGSLSVFLAVGLSLLGILDHVNASVSKIVMQGGSGLFPKALPGWSLWLATLVFAFGMSFAILSIPGTWRRVVVWLTALVLLAGWAPVLSLAAHSPEIGAPFIATLWSGVCALVYAGKHRMACDALPRAREISDDFPHEAR
jgi:hypothetical protein